MRAFTLFLLVCLAAACGDATRTGEGEWGRDGSDDREEFTLPVRVQAPARGTVVDTIETQATLESDREATVYAEMDGRVLEKVRDLGDPVGVAGDGVAGDGDDPFLLARLDDRELQLQLQDARAKLKEVKGRVDELALEYQRAQREVAQARVALAEAEAAFRRTSSGIEDGTISAEENEKAEFARNLAKSKVDTALAAVEKAEMARKLAEIAIEAAEVAVSRAVLELENATMRAPFPGVVAACNVREGETITTGTAAYTIVDPDALVLYAEIPVRQALRVQAGNSVRIASSAVTGTTTGTVAVVSPTVQPESGMVRVKVTVVPAPGYRAGLYVDVRLVVATRANALVVPKRAVLHDDEEGSYLFVVEGERARRVLVETGFENVDGIEIRTGLDETSQVVVEGQDTLGDKAKVAVK